MSRQIAKSTDIERFREATRSNLFFRLLLFTDAVERFSEKNKDSNINWLQAFALITILSNENITIGGLRKIMFRSSYSITRLVDKMVKADLIVRYHTNKNRKILRLRLTRKGLDYLMEVENTVGRLNNELISSMNKDDVDKFIAVSKIVRHIIIDLLSK